MGVEENSWNISGTLLISTLSSQKSFFVLLFCLFGCICLLMSKWADQFVCLWCFVCLYFFVPLLNHVLKI